MKRLPDKIYIVDPYDEDGDLVENTEDVCWCQDAVGDENVAYISEQTVAEEERRPRGARTTPGTRQ